MTELTIEEIEADGNVNYTKDLGSMSAEERLQYTQQFRGDMLNAVTANGKNMPLDDKMINACKGLLKDIDANEFTKKRIITEDKSADADIQAGIIIAAMLNKTNDGKSFITKNSAYRPPVADFVLPDDAVDAGVLEPIGTPVDLDEIMAAERAKAKGY